MILLADTHLLLWVALTPARLSQTARNLIEDAANTPAFSVVSLWEISIKQARGRPDFRVNARRMHRLLLENGWREFLVESEHAITAGQLPPLHKDPFDRMLLAQAQVEGARLLTSDTQLARYGEPVLPV
ncbi:type II toxin-antitoxin system VapC family toxin [Caulobacter endophyticus]|uniref:PIN domain nuclease n=1 Tax=Caulobacter endophyticus TaxID=2172652 RepID=A0A2T9K7B4_9CAUL|nr:type II toxin-antitoxin system VapC family toxin [Caulobacter endophyticus]PVM91854.1 PIN domain nuclease [Caulobacter endophyticus]